MGRIITRLIIFSTLTLLAAAPLLAQGRGSVGSHASPVSRAVGVGSAPVTTFGYAMPAYGGFYSGYGGYGGYPFPYFGSYSPQAPYPYMPKFWWVGPYGIDDPRQDGYNPNAGYAWDSVGTLILTTYPAKARVKLNGTFIGLAYYLGPIQLPAGDHTLRIEANGYQPEETVVQVDSPTVQELDIRLKPMGQTARAPASK